MTNTENAGEEIVLDQKEEVLNLRQEEDNSEENNEKPKTKDASSKGENQAEEIEEEVEEEEEEKDKNYVQEIHEVKLQEQQDENDDNEEKEEKDDNEEKDDQNHEDNNQKPQEEVNLRIVRDNDDDDVKKSDLYLNLQPNLKVKVEWFKKDDDMNIEFSTASKSKVLLHWGVFKNNNTSQWCQPNNQFYPKLTSEPDAFSLNTEFSCLQDDDEQKIFI